MGVGYMVQEDGYRKYSTVYSDLDIMAGWKQINGQGNKQAREFGVLCHVVKDVTEEEAIALTRLCLEQFNIPSCAFWNGFDFSFYCGGAGGGYSLLRQRLERIQLEK